MPIFTAWALRWREKIYTVEKLDELSFNLISPAQMTISAQEDQLQLFLINPLKFWILWAVLYIIFCYNVCGCYVEHEKYGSGIGDYQALTKKIPLAAGKGIMVKIKYLIFHISFYIIGLGLSWFCYFHYYANCIYLVLLLIFLFWNAGKKEDDFIKKKIRELEESKANEHKEN